MADATVIKTQQLALHLNLSERRVQQLVAEGLPVKGRGRFDVIEASAWYVRYLQRALEKRSPNPAAYPAGSDAATAVQMAREKLRVTRAEADLRELELARKRGELVAVEDAAAIWEKAVEKMRARLLSSIAGAAVKCVNLETRAAAHKVLVDVVHDALNEVVAVADDLEVEE